MMHCMPSGPNHMHDAVCRCREAMSPVSRRGMLAFAGALTGGALLGRPASAASGDYEAMLVNCIDPRFTTNSLQYMTNNGMVERYSHFVFTGGPIGVVHPRFASWHDVFWDNLDITIQLHNIKRLIGLTHRDCGAAKLAFGDAAVATRQSETAAHTEALRAFAAEARRRTSLVVVTGIMDLNGTVDVVS